MGTDAIMAATIKEIRDVSKKVDRALSPDSKKMYTMPIMDTNADQNAIDGCDLIRGLESCQELLEC
eukprot:8960828-Alexandrium_andersonii.AAC.1